ncbi:MAG TPA: transglycosylase domain-containing protein [Chitinophagales bacterium]|nr:transglycosylase domain-containing protein [Chitinophagales bacterium]
MQTLWKPFQPFYQRAIGQYIDILAKAYPYPVKVLGMFLKGFAGLSGVLFVLYLLILLGAFGLVPNRGELKAVQNYTASEVYSQDSILLGKFFLENRTNAEFEDLPEDLIHALVSTEDARFYTHDGVDFISFIRVLIMSIILNDDAGGGSTITQQLAKNLFGRKDYGPLTMPVNKFREMIIAGRLEDVYSKDEILTLYFNTVPFGEDCYGIESSALRFFNKAPKDLKTEESAVLVGLLKANTTYNPRLNPDKSLTRRNTVLGLMVRHENHYLTRAQADSLQALPLTINYRRESTAEGLAPYFREYLKSQLEDWAKKNPKEDGSTWNIYTDGLKIYTTINGELQAYAEDAMREHMASLQKQFDKSWGKTEPWKNAKTDVVNAARKRSERYQTLKDNGYSDKGIQKRFDDSVKTSVFSWNGPIDTVMTPNDSLKHQLRFMQTGFLAMDPRTGYILAWVGGIDYRFFQYDHVRAKRQVGSTFKPIVYATAIEQGIDPCAYIPNKKVTYESYDNWTPGNSDGEYGGYYTMKGGLTHSVNTVAANLIMQTGVQPVIDEARKMGVTSKLPAVPSIALGTASISLLEMVTAYSCFANRGLRADPKYIVRIESQKGDTLYEDKAAKKTRALSQETADIMIQIMRNVVNAGTASRLRGTYGLGMDLAGKTGTTQDNTDGWFIGYNSRIVAGAWVGAEDPAIKWKTTALGQGAATALPIFGKFMSKSAKDADTRKYVTGGFTAPADSTLALLDCPMWIPDSLNTDSLGFFQRVIGNIKDYLEKKGEDSIITKYPGAEK